MSWIQALPLVLYKVNASTDIAMQIVESGIRLLEGWEIHTFKIGPLGLSQELFLLICYIFLCHNVRNNLVTFSESLLCFPKSGF